MNENMLMDLEVLNHHCDNVDKIMEAKFGNKESPFDFDDELKRLEWMVYMLYSQPDLLRDSKWELAQA